MSIVDELLDALIMAGAMGWQILWPLILGFTLSGVIQAVVRREKVTALMSDDSPRALAAATGLGAASSSCSYASVAIARSLFRKGANFTAAMAFEIASTNLVLELGIILWLLMGWQFTLAEFVGGPLMIIGVALGFRLWMRGRIAEAARDQADRGLAGSMEGHAAMDMSVQGDGGFFRRLFSRDGYTSVSHYFVMDWASVIRDIALGLFIAGAFAAWVPTSWLQAFFFDDHPLAAKLWGPLIGPLVAVVSFVCSVGNVPLAAVLWNGGISFGGVVSFLFADLIIIPIILIYRKYYGTRAALRITGIFYLAMAAAGYLVELVFTPLGLVPQSRQAQVVDSSISWDYTTWLNIAFLVLAAALLVRFVRTGGLPMLKMMSGEPDQQHTHGHDGHGHAGHGDQAAGGEQEQHAGAHRHQ
jgi:uncharacterized membrane protein YraQ (UPF0718 family)